MAEREKKCLVLIPPVIVARGEKHCLPSSGTENAVLQKIMLKEKTTYTRGSALLGEKKTREFVPKLCNFQWLGGHLKQRL